MKRLYHWIKGIIKRFTYRPVPHGEMKHERDVLEVVINELREGSMKTIEVDNCQDCPFATISIDGFFHGCVLDFNPEINTKLPKDKVHDECPLKDNEYKIKLK